QIALPRFFGNIGEVEVEDDLSLFRTARDNKIRIHRSRVDVDHEIWINPVVSGPVAAGKWAPLQAESILRFDLILRIVQQPIESFVQMRYVVSAVEVVVHEDFPIAVEPIMPPFEPLVGSEIEICNFGHGWTLTIQPYQNPSLPDGELDGHQSHRIPIK